MTAGSLPTLTVLLDDGTGTFPYDITSRVRMAEGLTGARGRQDELSQVTAPQPMLVLDNADGGLSYGSTIIASPSPILTDQQVRVKYMANATTVNRYTGMLVADNVTWPNGGDEFAIATVTLADIQAQAERRPFVSLVQEEILLDSPMAYYALSGPTGSPSAADGSGNQFPSLVPFGTGTAATFGSSTSPTIDGLTAAALAGGQGLNPVSFPWPGGAVGGYEGFFLVPTAPAAGSGGLIPDPNNNGTLGSQGWVVTMNTTGQLVFGISGLTTLGYADGRGHHVFYNAVTSTLYVDGVSVATDAGAHKVTYQTVAATGSIAHLAYWPSASVPAAGRITAHASAGLNGFTGESGVARITRLANYAAVPLGTLDASLTNVAAEPINSKSAMSALQDVADAEFGLVFFDGSGNLTFHNRNRAVAKTAPDVTIDANQLDPGTAFYYDTAGILNFLQVTAQGTQVVQVARNTVSELGAAGSPKHGRYEDSKTYLVQTDPEALDRGNWLVNRHGQPAPRAGSLVVDVLTMTAAQQAVWLLVEPNYWVRITGLPAQTPGGTTADLIVQGWLETLNESMWTLALNTSSRPAFYQAWILDDTTFSVLDSTTRLYV